MTLATQTATIRSRRWNTQEYNRLAELDFFRDQHVELIGGKIVQMPPQKDAHAAAVLLTRDALIVAFGAGHCVRDQLPLRLGKWSEPEPDVAVVPGSPREYIGTGHPTSALLIVEVSEATLRYDRQKKAGLYAKHGIRDYWIVNLIDNQIEVHRDPIPAKGHAFGHRYNSITQIKLGQSLRPFAANADVKADDLLP